MGSVDTVHQEEGWLRSYVHGLPQVEQVNDEEPLPLPCIDDLFDQMQGGSSFSKIDLRSGFH